MTNQKMLRSTILMGALTGFSSSFLIAGDLTPPAGPPTSTFKTLGEIEPRMLLDSFGGSAAAKYTIDKSGAVYLTGNVIGEAGMHGIEITTNGVVLDLNGFSVVGVPGSLNGISGVPGLSDIMVRNGHVRNWGNNGVSLHSNYGSQVVDINSVSNAVSGIHVAPASNVTRCVARDNQLDGIRVGRGSVVSQCAAANNTTEGFWFAPAVSALNCSAYENGGIGFLGKTGCTFVGCASWLNTGNGFDCEDGCVISACTCRENGGAGIEATNSLIRGNASGANTGLAIDGGGNSTLVENHTY